MIELFAGTNANNYLQRLILGKKIKYILYMIKLISQSRLQLSCLVVSNGSA